MIRLLCALSILAIASATTATTAAETSVELFPVARDGLWGYIDRTGTLVIAPQFDGVDDFHDGIARVRIHGAARFIDAAGKPVALPTFDRVGEFSEGLAAVNTGEKRESNLGLLMEPGKWGYIDHGGKLVIPMRFTAADAFSEGLAAVRGKEASGFIDRHGKLVIRAGFDTTTHFSEGISMLSLHGHRRYIDKTGHTLPTPTLDDDAGKDFSEGYAAVSIGGKWGYIDATGKLAIAAQYIDAEDFSSGLAAVQLPIDRATETPCKEEQSSWTSGKKFGYIDRKGAVVVQPQFDVAGPFVEGLAPVRTCNTVSFIDSGGKVVLATKFDEALAFHNGLAQVWSGDERGLLKGYIDKTGKLIWAPSK